MNSKGLRERKASGSTVVALGLCHPACRGSWSLAGHRWGIQRSSGPGTGAVSGSCGFHRILQHPISGQWLPTASGKGCPPRSCCYSPTRREGQPPNPPITATLGPVCGHEGQLGQARGGLLSQGHQQGKHESGLEGKAVLGEQGAGDTVSGRVGSEAQTPQWNKSLLKEGKVRKAGVAAEGFLP